MNFQKQKKSHYDYHPLPREEGDPDEMETIKLLANGPREKLERLFEDGTLKTGDLDHKSIMTLQQLSEPLQLKVIEYLQTERLFLANSRSKAGFLVSACDRAKKGELDARGFGALDPWRSALVSECTPRIEYGLVSEREWIQNQSKTHISINIEADGLSQIFLFDLVRSVSQFKDLIFESMKPQTMTRNRMKLCHPLYGSLRDERSLAFYNLKDQDTLLVRVKQRGGKRVARIS